MELVVQWRFRDGEADGSGSRASDAREPLETGLVDPSGAGDFASRRVALRIGWREKDLQQQVKSAGGQWDPGRRVWYLRRDVAEQLDLLSRVVYGGG